MLILLGQCVSTFFCSVGLRTSPLIAFVQTINLHFPLDGLGLNTLHKASCGDSSEGGKSWQSQDSNPEQLGEKR